MIIVVYLLILVAAFFVLVVRPQRRQMATHRALVSTLTPGDEIVTSGGILGTIRDLDDETVSLEVAPAVVIRVARGAIARRVVAVDDTPPDDTPST
ncbi:MAG TPA: preprotein translocase subunit YajC [Acidimicrobiia bacterium]|nr:preprotein translocase subunit YajC [Acidimicrobiia bacterium]